MQRAVVSFFLVSSQSQINIMKDKVNKNIGFAGCKMNPVMPFIPVCFAVKFNFV